MIELPKYEIYHINNYVFSAVSSTQEEPVPHITYSHVILKSPTAVTPSQRHTSRRETSYYRVHTVTSCQLLRTGAVTLTPGG